MVLRAFLARRRAAALLRPPEPDAPGVRLADVRRRLEILVAALYGRPVAIAPAPDRKRGLGALRRGAGPPPGSAWNDGERIFLPASLDGDDALDRYRLLAVAQAERVARGTASMAPPGDDALERDLYLLFESAAVDAAIAHRMPGLSAALGQARAAERARRSATPPRGGAARAVEAMVAGLLAAEPSTPPAELARCDTPAESLRRARAAAVRIRTAGRYRGMRPVAHWGWGSVVAPPPASGDPPPPVPRLVLADDVPRAAGGKELAPGDGESDVSADGETVHDAGAATVPGAPGGDEPDDGPAGEARPGEESEGTEEARETGVGETRSANPPEGPAAGAASTVFPYPEWDYQAGRHRTPGAFVRIHPADETGGAPSADALRENAALARRIRQQFERLRARRTQLHRQPRGDELDLDACVRMLTELRAGRGGDDRLYTAVLPARRDVAIALLVDISGSTSEVVGTRRVIDVEKLAILLTAEALDALGDPYSILCFSGKTAGNVRIRQIKGFQEQSTGVVRRRVDALRPEGFTRLGAAIRHATALLRAQPAGHRLLLILSDGKPNDEDGYEGRYAVEDSRQAIAEARGSGIHAFCLTVDTKGGDYLPRIFGPAGHVILNRVDLLPRALVGVIREIFRR